MSDPVLARSAHPTLDDAIAGGEPVAVRQRGGGVHREGSTARYVAERATAGMIGVNVGVPVPREPFGFGGWGDSSFGSGEITGPSSLDFWTRNRKTTSKWNRDAGTNWMS